MGVDLRAPRWVFGLAGAALSAGLVAAASLAAVSPSTLFPTAGRIVLTGGCGIGPGPCIETIRPDGSHVGFDAIPYVATNSAGARLSPDGHTLAYEFDGSISLHTPGGGTDRVLTNPGGKADCGDGQPAWFPDGRRLVFVRGAPASSGDCVTSLWTVDTHGGRPKRLYTPPAGPTVGFSNVATPDVAHDGLWIAFDDDQGNLWQIHPNGTHLRRFGPADLRGLQPRWSPNDQNIAFVDVADGIVHTLNLKTGTDRAIHVGDDAPEAFAWSPDGRWLAVADDHSYDCNDPTGPCDRAQLWIVNTANPTIARRIHKTSEGVYVATVDWSQSAKT
jgi:Tol biopolymer transport system component